MSMFDKNLVRLSWIKNCPDILPIGNGRFIGYAPDGE
jgi:hypothetical protein